MVGKKSAAGKIRKEETEKKTSWHSMVEYNVYGKCQNRHNYFKSLESVTCFTRFNKKAFSECE